MHLRDGSKDTAFLQAPRPCVSPPLGLGRPWDGSALSLARLGAHRSGQGLWRGHSSERPEQETLCKRNGSKEASSGGKRGRPQSLDQREAQTQADGSEIGLPGHPSALCTNCAACKHQLSGSNTTRQSRREFLRPGLSPPTAAARMAKARLSLCHAALLGGEARPVLTTSQASFGAGTKDRARATPRPGEPPHSHRESPSEGTCARSQHRRQSTAGTHLSSPHPSLFPKH